MSNFHSKQRLLAWYLLLWGAVLSPGPASAERSLTVGVYDNAPLVSFHGARPEGLFVDLLSDVAEEEEWKITYRKCKWESCLELLKNRQIDVLTAVADSDKRRSHLDFNRETIIVNWGRVYCRPGSDMESVLDLKNKRVALLKDDIYAQAFIQLLQQFHVTCRLSFLLDYHTILKYVQDGRADAGIVNRFFGTVHEKGFDVHRTPIVFHPVDLRFAVPKGRNRDVTEALDRHLKEWKTDRNSPYYQAINRWLEGAAPAIIPPWLVWTTLGAALAALILLSGTLFLRHQVKKKTAELHNQVLEKKEAQKRLEDERSWFETVFQHAPVSLWEEDFSAVDEEFSRYREQGITDLGRHLSGNLGEVIRLASLVRIVAVNKATLAMYGARSLDELNNNLTNIIPAGAMTAFGKALAALYKGKREFSVEATNLTIDGKKLNVIVTWTVVPGHEMNLSRILVAIIDITQRIKHENKICQTSRALTVLSRCNEALVHASDEPALLREICRIIVSEGKYLLCWIGFREESANRKAVRPVAGHGIDMEYLESIDIRWDDSEYSKGPTGTAVRTGRHVICQDIQNNPSFAPWREEAMKRGYASSIALPLALDEEVFGAINIYAREPFAFDSSEVELLLQLADDLSYGIKSLRWKQELILLNQELESRVAERTKSLDEANEALEAFAYSVSHDLMAPVRAINGYAKALEEDCERELSDPARDYVRKIGDGAARMSSLIKDLLEYSRLGRTALRLQATSLETVVNTALSNLAGEVESAEADITVRGHMPECLADRTILVQVIENLISNALKFVPGDRKPSIHISAEKDKPGYVKLSVQDNGIGIEQRHLDRIFTIFERLHGIDAYPGTGVGLAIVKKGAEAMGGEAGGESSPGKGSTFWIRLRAPENRAEASGT